LKILWIDSMDLKLSQRLNPRTRRLDSTNNLWKI